MFKTHIVVRLRVIVATLTLAAFTGTGLQAAQPEFQPRVGQGGKDVIWVPTPISLIDRMLRLANVGPGDRVVDLGSGDGRIAIAAARDFNVPATGIEYNPDMVALSNRNAVQQGVAGRVKFIQGDIFEADFSEATVVTMYLLPSLNLRLRPKLLAMKPGTRIVSHAFNMEDWQPDSTINVEGQNAYYWVVPAQVGGTWRLQLGAETVELKIAQEFQNFKGAAGPTGAAFQGFLRGDVIRMTVPDGRGGRRDLVGKVTGEQMAGTAGSEAFSAQRIALPAP